MKAKIEGFIDKIKDKLKTADKHELLGKVLLILAIIFFKPVRHAAWFLIKMILGLYASILVLMGGIIAMAVLLTIIVVIAAFIIYFLQKAGIIKADLVKFTCKGTEDEKH